jgi:hypothetical protein
MSLDEVTFIARVVRVKGPKEGKQYSTYRITIPKPIAEAMALEEGAYLQVHIKKMNIGAVIKIKRGKKK